ncbi:MAG: hypothetical protein C0501_28940 [Isosphaera sp.]|nr:hypothetical protein [Isosphaera sp.]
MRTLFGFGMAVALAAGANGQDKKAEKLDGSWLIVGMEKGGEKLPDEFFKKAPEKERTVRIAGDKMIAMKGDKEDAIAVKFDPTKTPMQMTATETKPGGKGETTVGIYKVEGDTLTICMVESDKEADRPKEFKTGKDSKAMILVLKRQK